MWVLENKLSALRLIISTFTYGAFVPARERFLNNNKKILLELKKFNIKLHVPMLNLHLTLYFCGVGVEERGLAYTRQVLLLLRYTQVLCSSLFEEIKVIEYLKVHPISNSIG